MTTCRYSLVAWLPRELFDSLVKEYAAGKQTGLYLSFCLPYDLGYARFGYALSTGSENNPLHLACFPEVSLTGFRLSVENPKLAHFEDGTVHVLDYAAIRRHDDAEIDGVDNLVMAEGATLDDLVKPRAIAKTFEAGRLSLAEPLTTLHEQLNQARWRWMGASGNDALDRRWDEAIDAVRKEVGNLLKPKP